MLALFRRYGLTLKLIGGEDATDVFNNQKEDIYTDFVHYNEKGKGLMVERLSQIVLQHLTQKS